MLRSVALIATYTIFVLFATSSPGQEPRAAPRPYDGIQAGLDAFRLGEERRQANIAEQLFVNDQVKYWAGLPTSRGETIYDGSASPNYFGYGNAVAMLPPADLEYTYAYGRWGSRGRVSTRVWTGPRTVFEPWPFVPGDIYGYRYYSPLRQPIGQQQTQTGPNLWESHPVYDPPLADLRPLPPVDSPWLDGTPFESPPAPADAGDAKPAGELPPEAPLAQPPRAKPPLANPPLRGPRDY